MKAGIASKIATEIPENNPAKILFFHWGFILFLLMLSILLLFSVFKK
jgi:hypothetical protein